MPLDAQLRVTDLGAAAGATPAQAASSSRPLSAKERRSQVPVRPLLPKRDRVAAEREEAAAVKQQQEDEERKRLRRKMSLRALLKSADGLYPRRYVCICILVSVFAQTSRRQPPRVR
jgi:hypothetical protein